MYKMYIYYANVSYKCKGEGEIVMHINEATVMH